MVTTVTRWRFTPASGLYGSSGARRGTTSRMASMAAVWTSGTEMTLSSQIVMAQVVKSGIY